MKTHTDSIEALVERAEQYGKASLELYRLKAIARSADIASSLASKLLVAAFFSLFFLVLNIGAALWIGESLGKLYLGFFIVAAFYAMIVIVLYVSRDKLIKTPLRNSIIIQALN